MSRTVLEEAIALTDGDRAEAYGDAFDMAERWARIASAATGLPLRATDLPVVMVALKLARMKPGAVWHRDSWVDVAGYARVAELIEEGWELEEDGDRELEGDGLGSKPFSGQRYRSSVGDSVWGVLSGLDRVSGVSKAGNK